MLGPGRRVWFCQRVRGLVASLRILNSPTLQARFVVCFFCVFPKQPGRRGARKKNLPVKWAGLALFKDRQVARSAEIFQRRRALSGFSPERCGGSSLLKFFAGK